MKGRAVGLAINAASLLIDSAVWFTGKSKEFIWGAKQPTITEAKVNGPKISETETNNTSTITNNEKTEG